MSIFLTVISVCAAIFSCFCAYKTAKACGNIRASIEREKQVVNNFAQAAPSAEPPRYREYGDLS